MEEDLCYICLEKETEETKFLQNGICHCKNMKIHNECFLLLNSKYKCSVCRSTYENFVVKQNNKILKFHRYGLTEQYYMNQSDRKEGLYILKLYDSKVLLHCFYKDGMRDGLYQQFYQDTQIKEFGYYIEGKKQGTHLIWYPNKKLKEFTEYHLGIPHGHQEFFSMEGNTIMSLNFDNNKLNGLFRLYHPNGKIWIKTNFKLDLIDGNYKEYDTEGIIISDLVFKDDKFIGLTLYLSIITFIIRYEFIINLFGFFIIFFHF